MGLSLEDAERLGIGHEHPDHPARKEKGKGERPRRRGPAYVVSVTGARPGHHVIEVAGWCPASKNLKARGWRVFAAAKKRDRDVIAGVGSLVPKAVGRRAVRTSITRPGVLPDPINLTESLADALVAHGLLRDDSAGWADIATPVVERGKVTRTVIVVEDIGWSENKGS